MLDDHLTVCIEFVVSLGEGRAFHELLGQVYSSIDQISVIIVVVVNEVVCSFELNQLVSQLLHTVQVECAISLGTMLDDHLAVCIEFVVSLGEGRAFHEFLGQVYSSIDQISVIIVVVVNEVVCSFELNQLVSQLLHTVQVECAISLRTMLDDHLTVCIEFVVSLGEGRAFHELLGQVYSSIDQISVIIVVVVNEVVCSFELNQLVSLLLHTVQIERAVSLWTMLLNRRIDHSTLIIKLIHACRKQTIGARHVIGAGNSIATAVNVIVVTALENKACRHRFTILQISSHGVAYENAGMIRYIFANQDTFIGELVKHRIRVTANNQVDTFVAVTLSVKAIGLAIDLCPHNISMGACGSRTVIVTGAIAVLCSLLIGYPCTHGAAVFIKDIGDAVDGLFTHSKLIGRVCEALAAIVRILPAGNQLAANGVVQIAVHFKHAGTGLINMAAAFILTNELSINNFVIMSNLNLIDDSAPVYNGLTGLAVGTVLITGLCCGSFLIENGQFLVMHMVGGGDRSQFGSNIDGASEGSTVNFTINHLALDIDHRLIAQVRRCVIGIGHIVITVKGPHTDRDADQSLVSRLCLGSINQLNSHGQQFGNLIVIEGCLEAICNHGALGFPGVGVVQLQLCNQLGNAGQIRNINVHVVDRLRLGSFAGIIMTGQCNSGITGNCESTAQSCRIAQFILNLESYGMGTGIQHSIFLGRQNTAGNASLNSKTVHIDLSGSQIKCCIVGNGSSKSYFIAVDNYSVLQSHSGIRGRISGRRNGGQDSVIHSRTVIQSDVINVESNDIRSVRLDVSTDKRGRTGVPLISRYRRTEVIVLGNIDTCIDPAGLGDICIGSRVQVGLLTGCCRSKHEVVLLAGVGAVSVLGVELGLESQALAGRGECIFRNIQPHTQSSCLHAVGNVTQNDHITGIKQNIVRPACKGSVAVVQSPCQCIFTVSDLSTVLLGGNKGSTAQVFIKLTGKRITANESVVDIILLAPLLGFFKTHETGSRAIFEVIDNFRALAKCDGVGQHGFTVCDSHIHAGNGSIIGSGEIEAIQSTSSFIGKRNGNCIGVHINIGFTGHCHDGQCNGADLIHGGIGNHSGGCGKHENFRIRNGNRLGSDHIATGCNLDIHITLSAIGNKLSVFNGAERSIRKYPTCIRRHIHRIAMGINRLCTKGIDCFGRKDIIFCSDIHHIQNTGGSNVGCNEDTVCGGTLCAVTGNAAHGKVIFTNTLGQESGRTTAVAVCCPLTPQGEHDFAFLIRAQTNGVVGASTVIHTNNEGAVLLNANHGTGSIIRTTCFFGVDQLSILNNHCKRNAYCVKQSASFKVCVQFILIKCLNIAGNIAFCILKYIQNRRSRVQHTTIGVNILAKVTNELSIINKNTGRVGAVVKVCVHTADDVVSEFVLVILCHLGQFLMSPVCLIFGILSQLIDLIVSGNNGHIRVGWIYFNDVQNLSAGTGGIVEHDLGFNCRAGNEYVILL